MSELQWPSQLHGANPRLTCHLQADLQFEPLVKEQSSLLTPPCEFPSHPWLEAESLFLVETMRSHHLHWTVVSLH